MHLNLQTRNLQITAVQLALLRDANYSVATGTWSPSGRREAGDSALESQAIAF